ncbi:Arb2 domain-containing protein [Hypomontagnella monticulosa]|nr:Arb2 domain-containing protein [Hypomontagnella monticulosa]
MFRRKWSGLPADPEFPTSLKELGYFVNDDDEIRSIENPDTYFHFFLSRNQRWNDRQRYCMNQSLQDIIWERLENLGMKKVPLPLGTTDLTKLHVPIFISKDIAAKSRVVVIFGESAQALGVLAQRVVGGAGGVSKGSMVSIVSKLQKQRSSPSDSSPPGIILANMGELLWWPAGNRALSVHAFNGTPRKSAVHFGHEVTDKNKIPHNADMKEHVHYIFDEVIPHFVKDSAKIDVVGVGDSAETVEQYLDLPPIWPQWKDRISSLSLVGGMHPVWELKNDEFVNVFLRNKARAYITSDEPAGMAISGPEGNPKSKSFTQIGCPVFSSGEPYYIECVLIAGADVILDWIQEVAMTPENEDYANPEFHIVFDDPPPDDWHDWTDCKGEESDLKDEAQAGKDGNEDASAEAPKQRLVVLNRPSGDHTEDHDEDKDAWA